MIGGEEGGDPRKMDSFGEGGSITWSLSKLMLDGGAVT